MGEVETFQIPLEAAEAYEQSFVPRLFRDWAELMGGAAGIGADDRVLDVATGTGVVARTVSERARSVVGVDLNESMLKVARGIAPGIEWKHADAAQLPFEDASFDVVFCQAGLMFFPDPVRALAEMARVAAAGGRVAVQVWDRLGNQAPYITLAAIAARHAGPDATDLMGTYFKLGDLDTLKQMADEAGLGGPEIRTHETVMSFGSLDEFVRTEVAATPLAAMLSEDVLDRIVEEARDGLSGHVDASGAARIPIRGHILVSGVQRRRRLPAGLPRWPETRSLGRTP